MADVTLVCKVCGEEFQFVEGEQKFYEEKGFVEPKRCPGCRKAAREARKNKEEKGGK